MNTENPYGVARGRPEFHQWLDKHPRITGITGLGLMALFAAGFVTLCIIGPRLNQKPEPVISERGSEVQRQFLELNDDDQSIIAQQWNEEHPLGAEEDPDPPQDESDGP